MPTPDRPPLTSRQSQCLGVIRQHWLTLGKAPTLRFVCKAMKIASPNGTLSHVRSLRQKGYLKDAPGAPGRRGKRMYAVKYYVLADAEVVVTRSGDSFRIAVSGPGVTMGKDEWREVAGSAIERGEGMIDSAALLAAVGGILEDGGAAGFHPDRTRAT